MLDLPFYQFFSTLPGPWVAAGLSLLVLVFGYTGARFSLWTLAGVAVLYGFGSPAWLWIAFGVVALVGNIPPIRQAVFSGVIMKVMNALKFLPTISKTEQTAIEAGNVWVEGELFSGKPDFKRILNEPYPGLTEEEQAFLDGPVNELCDAVNDWEVFQTKRLPERAWEIIRREKLFGMIIPKEYGGLSFSPLANSAVVQKLSSCCGPLATTVMVPNSLGPGELLTHYGTQAQRDYFLPKLAAGEFVPAFALTEPNAGSDAGAISSRGEVFKGEDGELYVRLNWKKRYITLAAIADVLGLAFKLYDPENHLGLGENVGITCALVETTTKGVVLGKRHDPMGVPFWNCPTEGHDVVVKLEDAIIGGSAWAGKGWRMLMESLAAGRGISLPASAAGASKLTFQVASAHAKVRKQFGLPIGLFEGIEEPLAEIGGFNYAMEAARVYTCGAIGQGVAPAVVTAIAKYNMTEMQRTIVNHGMDILGGNAISRGPRNMMASAYMNTPVGITVEGANILTRTLMIFGQGAIRCHPYIYNEIQGLTNNDVKVFDKAFVGHIGHTVRNMFRASLLSLTRGRLALPPVTGPTSRYWQKIAWASASFAFLSDVALISLGGSLKRKEKITGRFADIFSWLYIGASTLRRFEEEGQRKEDLPYMRWVMEYSFAKIQDAFEGLYKNFSVPVLGLILKGPVLWWARMNAFGRGPSDKVGHKVAQSMQTPGEQRERLTAGIYKPTHVESAQGRLQNAFELAYEGDKLGSKLRRAIKAKLLPKAAPAELVKMAVEKGVISLEEAEIIQRAEAARNDAIQVDDFTVEEYMRGAIIPAGGDGASGDGASIEAGTPTS